MMKHEITLSQLQEFMAETKVLFARVNGALDGKSMHIDLRGNIIITYKGEVVWKGMQPYSAVEEYNKIQQ